MEHLITVLPLNFTMTPSQRAFDASVASVNAHLHHFVAAVYYGLDVITDDYTEVNRFDRQDIADSRDFALKGYLGTAAPIETTEQRERRKEYEGYHEEIEYPRRRTIPNLEVSEDQDKFEWDLSEAFGRVMQHRQIIRNLISTTWRREQVREDLSETFEALRDCVIYCREARLKMVRQGETADEMAMRRDAVWNMLYVYSTDIEDWVRRP